MATIGRIRRQEFTSALQGRRFHGQYVSIVVSPAGQLQVAVVVSKKVYTSAVARNRIKRQVRGWFIANGTQLVPQRYLVVLKPVAKTATSASVLSDLEVLLAQFCISR